MTRCRDSRGRRSPRARPLARRDGFRGRASTGRLRGASSARRCRPRGCRWGARHWFGARWAKACRGDRRLRFDLGRERGRRHGVPDRSGVEKSPGRSGSGSGRASRGRARCSLGCKQGEGTVSRIDPDAEAVVDTIDLRGVERARGMRRTPSRPMPMRSGSLALATSPESTHSRASRWHSSMSAASPSASSPDGRALWVATMAEQAVQLELRTSAHPRSTCRSDIRWLSLRARRRSG